WRASPRRLLSDDGHSSNQQCSGSEGFSAEPGEMPNRQRVVRHYWGRRIGSAAGEPGRQPDRLAEEAITTRSRQKGGAVWGAMTTTNRAFFRGDEQAPQGLPVR